MGLPNFWPLFFLSLVFCSVVMGLTWVWARSIKNYSIVDGAWALSFFGVVLLYEFLAPGWGPRRGLILLVAGAWSLRLGFFLARRIYRHHPQEDSRYLTLRAQYAPRVAQNFFWFFQYQAWSVVILSVPFLLVTQNERTEFLSIEWMGLGLSLLALLGEAIADGQANRFKQNPKNRGGVCQLGLWKYSRHPNYFFESLIWWGFYLMALGSSGGVWTLYCPLLILFLLLKVTGVPLAEAQSLKSRGEAYREYQRKTPVFFPWFPKGSK